MKDKKKRKLELRENGDGKEYRHFPVEELRVVRGEGEPIKIEGHAAVFNKWSDDLGGFREKIAPGAFEKSIGTGEVKALYNHNTDMVMGSLANGSLELKEDKTGLFMSMVPPDTTYARDAIELIDKGYVTNASFGFFTVRDEWTYPDEKKAAKGALAERELIEVDVFDVSPVVAYPAYPQTSVTVRSAFPDIDTIMAKVASDEELTDEDRDAVQSAIDTLSNLTPELDGSPEGGDSDPVVQDLTALKLLLEIEDEL
jgi:hypothetical protein